MLQLTYLCSIVLNKFDDLVLYVTARDNAYPRLGHTVNKYLCVPSSRMDVMPIGCNRLHLPALEYLLARASRALSTVHLSTCTYPRVSGSPRWYAKSISYIVNESKMGE